MECIKSKHYQSPTIVFIIAPQSTRGSYDTVRNRICARSTRCDSQTRPPLTGEVFWAQVSVSAKLIKTAVPTNKFHFFNF